MTVIAWDGKTLAGDRRAVANNLPFSVQKVHRSGNVIFGVSGSGADLPMFKAWVEQEGMVVAAFPKVSDSFVAILVKNGQCFRYEGARPVEIVEPFHAVGCGRDLAIAALHCGKSAREAVEIAILYDVYCGNGIDVISCDPEEVI